MPYSDPEKQREYQQRWHQKNKQLRKVRAEVRKAEFRKIVYEMKSEPCTDCKQRFNPWQMQFDHVHGEKIEAVSRMIANKQFKAALLEIDKCELVCANCHADRTYRRLQSNKSMAYSTIGSALDC